MTDQNPDTDYTVVEQHENKLIVFTVEADARPAFDYQYEVRDGESPQEAFERTVETAKREAAVALQDLAHEYEFQVASSDDN